MTDCIFCKIIKKEIPAEIVYENDNVIAFLDKNPINKGHTLVIPKNHFTDLLDTPDDVLCEILSAAKKIAGAVVKAVDADGFNIGVNNKPAAGQIVMHTHFHVIPRFSGDGKKHWLGKELPKEQMTEIKGKIVKFL